MKNRKLSLFRCGAILALSAVAAVPSHAAFLSFSGLPASFSVGQQIQIGIDVEDAIDLWAFELDFGFSSASLEVVSVEEGGFLNQGDPASHPTFFLSGNIDNSAGTVSLIANTLEGTVPGVSGSGRLATLTLLATTSGQGQVNTFNESFLDFDFNDVLIESARGAILVEDNQVDPPIGTVPEPGTLALSGLGVLACLVRRSWRFQSK